MKLSVGLCLFK